MLLAIYSDLFVKKLFFLIPQNTTIAIAVVVTYRIGFYRNLTRAAAYRSSHSSLVNKDKSHTYVKVIFQRIYKENQRFKKTFLKIKITIANYSSLHLSLGAKILQQIIKIVLTSKCSLNTIVTIWNRIGYQDC